jgi:hypothetical protein
VASKLSHRDDRETLWLGIGQTFGNRGADSLVNRAVGKIGQESGDALERKLARKIAERNRERQSVPALPKALGDGQVGCSLKSQSSRSRSARS